MLVVAEAAAAAADASMHAASIEISSQQQLSTAKDVFWITHSYFSTEIFWIVFLYTGEPDCNRLQGNKDCCQLEKKSIKRGVE